MNKCAKFHGDGTGGWTFRDGRSFCVQLCIETLYKRASSVAHLTNFSFEFFYAIFTEGPNLLCLYHGAKKVKHDKKLKSRGGGGVLPYVRDSVMHPGEFTLFCLTYGRWSFKLTANSRSISTAWRPVTISTVLLQFCFAFANITNAYTLTWDRERGAHCVKTLHPWWTW